MSDITASLRNAHHQGASGAGTDTLSGFENLTGGSGDDVLTGNAGVNILAGGAGDDALPVSPAMMSSTVARHRQSSIV